MWRNRNASISHQNSSRLARGPSVSGLKSHTAEMSLLLLQTSWQPALFVVCVRARYEWMLHFWSHCSQNTQSTQTKKVRNPNTHHEGISHLTPSPGSLDFFPTPHRPCFCQHASVSNWEIALFFRLGGATRGLEWKVWWRKRLHFHATRLCYGKG